jgi:hypothetical protein
MRRSVFFRGRALLFALVLAGCGGGSGAGSAPSSSQSGASTARLTITVPQNGSTQAQTRSPQYVSPAAKSAEVDVIYGSLSAVGATTDLVAGNGVCVTSGSVLQCTLSLLVQPGASNFVVKLFDQTGEQGHVVSTATVAVPPSNAGAIVNVPVTLLGTVGEIGLALSGGSFTSGTAGTRTLTVTGLDFDGDPIAGSFNQPILLTSMNPSVTIAPTSVTTNGTAVTLSYTGSGDPTISIKATDADGGTATYPSVGALSVSPSNLELVAGAPQTLFISQGGSGTITLTSSCAQGAAITLSPTSVPAGTASTVTVIASSTPTTSTPPPRRVRSPSTASRARPMKA